MRKLNNKGISLIEYVLVFAIILIIGGALSIGLSLVSSKPADQCSRQMKIAIDNFRTNAMGKDTASLKIFVKGDGRIAIEENLDGATRESIIGSKGVVVKYKVPSGPTTFTESTLDTTGVIIKFNRTSGALELTNAGATNYYIKEYTVSKGSVTKTVNIVPLTGKVTVK